jgi:Skp family chaperone for outer membrane proteins
LRSAYRTSVRFAQTAPPTAPAAVVICVFSKEEALRTSLVGKYVANRMQQIASQLRAKLESVLTDPSNAKWAAKTEEAQRADKAAGIPQSTQSANWRGSMELESKVQNLKDELQATQERASARLDDELNPMVRRVYAQRNCTVLLDRTAVYGGDMNPNSDISPDVVRLLDAKITQFPVDVVNIPVNIPQDVFTPGP